MARPTVEHVIDGMYTCRRCKLSKPIDQYWKSKHKPSGICQYCKVCSNFNRQETRIRIKTGTTKFTVGLYKKGTEEYRTHTRNQQLKYNHGITAKEYNELFSAQKGCCAICKAHQNTLKKKLHVDHDHSTGKVRGLLCWSCNVGLGIFKDNTEILNSVIGYLQDHRKKDTSELANVNLN